MTTRALTSPPRALRQLIEADRKAARNAAPPDPDAWLAFLCRRCEKPFRVHGIARHCTKCIHGAAAAGVIGSEHIGEVSGT